MHSFHSITVCGFFFFTTCLAFQDLTGRFFSLFALPSRQSLYLNRTLNSKAI